MDERGSCFSWHRSRGAITVRGGTMKELVVGRALMSNPRLLMLDEPILGLSPLMSQRVGR